MESFPLSATFAPLIEWLRTTWLWPGFAEVGQFLGTHLISGMVPAFFIAGAISVFVDKQHITELLGPRARPWLAYPIAACTGGILTVCSCGTIPLFTGILMQGAGTGPAFTFLFATPAINLIAVMYTFTYMGSGVMLARVIGVIVCALAIGMVMRFLFPDQAAAPKMVPTMMVEEESSRSSAQLGVFFALLVAIMLTSTGIFDRPFVRLMQKVGVVAETSTAREMQTPIDQQVASAEHPTAASPSAGEAGDRTLVYPVMAKFLLLAIELGLLIVILKRWFLIDEIKQWLEKSWSLFVSIFPMVLIGLFVSGALASLLPMLKFMSWFRTNTAEANVLVSFIGAMSYFGTIVGVNIVATMSHFGMHLGPCLALLLAGPAVSLPSILALVPIVGPRKSAAYLFLVVVCSATTGYIYGTLQ